MHSVSFVWGGRTHELGTFKSARMASVAENIGRLLASHFLPGPISIDPAIEDLRSHPDVAQLLSDCPSLDAALERLRTSGLAESLYYELTDDPSVSATESLGINGASGHESPGAAAQLDATAQSSLSGAAAKPSDPTSPREANEPLTNSADASKSWKEWPEGSKSYAMAVTAANLPGRVLLPRLPGAACRRCNDLFSWLLSCETPFL